MCLLFAKQYSKSPIWRLLSRPESGKQGGQCCHRMTDCEHATKCNYKQQVQRTCPTAIGMEYARLCEHTYCLTCISVPQVPKQDHHKRGHVLAQNPPPGSTGGVAVWASVWESELESKHHAGVVTHGSTRCENFEGLQLECCMLMRYCRWHEHVGRLVLRLGAAST